MSRGAPVLRRLLVATFDVTDFASSEVDALAGEVSAQAEDSGLHRDCTARSRVVQALVCPYCGAERSSDRDECGPEGEGVCVVYAAVMDFERRDSDASPNVWGWIAGWLADQGISSPHVDTREIEAAIRSALGAC